MTTGGQQYDTIQGPYDYIRTASIALIEREDHVATGFYTYSFLDWGAHSVLGVDISSVMIDEARRSGENVSFIQADCSIPQRYEGAPFDIVFGAWLLNYASDRTGLVDMFRNVAMNLRGGGRFVSITPPPSSNPIDSVNGEASARPLSEGGSGYLIYNHIKDVEDGIHFLYEEAAREAGLSGKLEWGVTVVPERYLKGEGQGGASLKELESYKTIPNYGVLVIEK
ncbi:hypothetical protein EYC84_010069 [Monilinia fructicola]|uniref:Methyltransferase domain-containing protein n=1 Tax=Monilinia fructicola TaxID=38448 RepID=A0A5M9JC98_MONFR|nr:hypothetical protein EYC84_010069 [Monilinia fructicola]